MVTEENEKKRRRVVPSGSSATRLPASAQLSRDPEAASAPPVGTLEWPPQGSPPSFTGGRIDNRCGKVADRIRRTASLFDAGGEMRQSDPVCLSDRSQ